MTKNQTKPNKKRRRRRKIITLIILILIVLLLFNPLRTISTLEKQDDYPIYTMNYHGGYSLMAWIWQKWVSGESSQADEKSSACSLFTALADKTRPLYGRNFDWQYSPVLVLYTDPWGGYASLSLVDLTYLGFDKEEHAQELDWGVKICFLAAPLLPLDGINEHGLVVSIASLSNRKTPYDADKKTVHSLHAVRMILDQARNVEEAIAIIKDHNIAFMPGPPLHYLIADLNGQSAVVELIEGEYKIYRSEHPWQVATNFYLAEMTKGKDPPCPRYQKAWNTLKAKNGKLTPTQAMNLLQDISLPITQWSVVYHLTNKKIDLVVNKNYQKPYTFTLEK